MKFTLLPLLAVALPLLVAAAPAPAPGTFASVGKANVDVDRRSDFVAYRRSPSHDGPCPPDCGCGGGSGGSPPVGHHPHPPPEHPTPPPDSMPIPTPTPTSQSSDSTSTDHKPPSTPSTTATTTTTVTVTGTAGGPTPTGNTCSSGPVQCCDSVQPAGSDNASQLLGLLGIVVQGLDVPIGLTCNPISIIGIGSPGSCNAQTVCCENNNFNGLVAIGCTPINLNL